MIVDCAEAEALRLAKAFYRIKDAKSRGMILSVVEAIARNRDENGKSPTWGVVVPGPGNSFENV